MKRKALALFVEKNLIFLLCGKNGIEQGKLKVLENKRDVLLQSSTACVTKQLCVAYGCYGAGLLIISKGLAIFTTIGYFLQCCTKFSNFLTSSLRL